MLAQAIVHKTLDMERQRQAEVRKRLDRISKIEMVKKVRVSRESNSILFPKAACFLVLVLVIVCVWVRLGL